jgi:glycosyltransferase involved in cell wall biosynthesis
MGVPRVSAIIIVLNGEDYITEAIESILAQDFDDWELIVVDDGSVDRTRDIVQRFIDADPERVRLLRHPDHGNHGMSATRNLGVEQARGKFIAFLDADDAWTPGKLKEQVAILDHHPGAAMAYGRTLIWNSWDPSSGAADHFYDLGVEPNAICEPPRLFLQLLENVHQTPTTCNAMIRKSVVQEFGGFDPRFRDMFEDQIFFAKLLLRYPVYVSDECWAKYRQHGSSASVVAGDPRRVRRAHLRYLRALRVYLLKHGYRFSRPRVAVERTIAGLHADRVIGGVRRRLRRLVRR